MSEMSSVMVNCQPQPVLNRGRGSPVGIAEQVCILKGSPDTERNHHIGMLGVSNPHFLFVCDSFPLEPCFMNSAVAW